MKKVTLLISAFAFVSCYAPKVAINRNADFSQVKRVAVIDFGGQRGNLAADFMLQNLLARGVEVVERQRINAVMRELNITHTSAFKPSTAKKIGKILGVDALFSGSVADISDAASYIVTTGEQAFSNVSRISNSSLSSGGSIMGVPDSQILTTAARVSLISRMIDVETGTVLWSASMTYEGFDVASAMDGITRSFVNSLVPIWPALVKIQ